MIYTANTISSVLKAQNKAGAGYNTEESRSVQEYIFRTPDLAEFVICPGVVRKQSQRYRTESNLAD